MKIKLLIVLVWASCLQLYAQDPVAQKYGNLITADELRENLTILASDALEGRETGKRGQKMAAAFVKAHFEEHGLTGPVNGGYYQPVELFTSMPGDIYIKAGETKFPNFENIVFYGASSTDGEISVPVVFAGKGSKEDFDQLDVSGKGVIIMVTSDANFQNLVTLAREKEAKMIFLFNEKEEDFRELLGQIKSYMGNGMLTLERPKETADKAGVFFVAPAVAATMMKTTPEKMLAAANAEARKKALKKMKAATIQYKTTMDITTLKSDNVLGYLEGTDKKAELVVITAHYDHIGKLKEGEGDLINNGADDDGSGTVTVLQLAKAFAQAKKEGKGPRRSILFMTVTGEEKGLLGSDYYTRNPVFPLASTVVNLNIDMVGRRDPQHKDSEPYVYVIGSDKLSSELHALSESVNKATTNLIFDYTYNDQDHPDRLYYRSDHWNFAKNNIPIIFYFDGIHEDYHQPSDEVEKIEFDLLTKRAQCVFYTAWEIANREQRIKTDQGAK
ncbi:MAG TPA: M28 family peptidase [Ohtaekwangia sp.]|nr:M28 family peptidase [Ohtaekwangia sp.]